MDFRLLDSGHDRVVGASADEDFDVDGGGVDVDGGFGTSDGTFAVHNDAADAVYDD